MMNKNIKKFFTGISFRVTIIQVLISLISIITLILLLQWIASVSLEKKVIENNQFILDYILSNIDNTTNKIKKQLYYEANQPTIIKILMLPENDSRSYIAEYINEIFFYNCQPKISLYNFKGDCIYTQKKVSNKNINSFLAKICISSRETVVNLIDNSTIQIICPSVYNGLPEGALGLEISVNDFFDENLAKLLHLEENKRISLFHNNKNIYNLGKANKGESVITGKIETLKININLHIAQKEIIDSINSMKYNMVLIGFLFIFTSIVLGFFFSRKLLVLPILNLRNSVLNMNHEQWQPLVTKDINVSELEELAKAFNEMQQIIVEKTGMLLHAEKLAGIGQLAAGIAHEINNPIGFVSGNTETIIEYIHAIKEIILFYEKIIDENVVNTKRRELDIDFILSDIDDLLNDNTEGLKRVKQIVASLKDFSRIDQSNSFSNVNLEKSLDSTLLVAKNEIKYYANIKKEYGDIPSVECISGEINQVFMNVIINAAHAIKEQKRDHMGTITIKTRKIDEENVCISISDDGPGISEENIDKIFNPFFTTKTVGQGTGLGLNISYDIIENKHNGSINVKSTEGKGTEFIITLPITRQVKNG